MSVARVFALWLKHLVVAATTLLPGIIVATGLLFQHEPTKVERIGAVLILVFALTFALVGLYQLLDAFIAAEVALNQLNQLNQPDGLPPVPVARLRALLVVVTAAYIGTLFALFFAPPLGWVPLVVGWTLIAATSATYADAVNHNAYILINWRTLITDYLNEPGQTETSGTDGADEAGSPLPEARYYAASSPRPVPSVPVSKSING
jgi:hypothetical protein